MTSTWKTVRTREQEETDYGKFLTLSQGQLRTIVLCVEIHSDDEEQAAADLTGAEMAKLLVDHHVKPQHPPSEMFALNPLSY